MLEERKGPYGGGGSHKRNLTRSRGGKGRKTKEPPPLEKKGGRVEAHRVLDGRTNEQDWY